MNDTSQRPMSEATTERRNMYKRGNRMLGRVVACNGSNATISAIAERGETDLTELWSVGRLVSISVGENRIVALAYAMKTGDRGWDEGRDTTFDVEVELLGEVRKDDDGKEIFTRGISRYPYLGAVVHHIRSTDLLRIYDTGLSDTCVVGKLTQDESLDAAIHIPSMLSKHFAVVGSTGVGKSTAVSLLLNKSIQSDPKLRILILDPHNEFAAAFPDLAVVIDTDGLDLPFWLMRLEEFSEVVFRGRAPVPEELDILRDVIGEAKRSFRGADSTLMRRTSERNSVTADTPVPYRMADLLALIDERLGRLDAREEKPFLRSLKMRITSAINDPRYGFLFSNNTINDSIMETVAHIFRIPGDDRPISVFQLAGIPSEVVNSVASILCRMAFELALWSNGAIHMLVVCEEAHRYVPADPKLGFFPTRQAIARIAKEGRKYGVSLGIITQRPGELDPTILSQCSTLFAMRLSNEHDQEIIRSAIPNSSISTTSFLSSIGNGEAIAFGEATSVPMRMKFSRVDETRLPQAIGTTEKNSGDTPDTLDLRTVIARMRAVSEPNIAAFQQSYAAANPHLSDDAGYGTPDYADDDFPPAGDVEVERWSQELNADWPAATRSQAPAREAPSRTYSPEPQHEPYRPDMLPTAPSPASPPSHENGPRGSSVIRREVLRREGPARDHSLRQSLLFRKPASRHYEED